MNEASSPAKSLRAARDCLLAEPRLSGRQWCRSYAAAADAWLKELFEQATGGDASGVALLAVGGYGRAELAPRSDLDLLLVHDRKRGAIEPVAESLWYAIWDEGISLDHSTRTLRELREAMEDDLKVALGLLEARPLAGDPILARRAAAAVAELWRARAGLWLPLVAAATRRRHEVSGDAAFLLEPDLKESRGGLRDLNLLRALGPVAPVLAGSLDEEALEDAAGVLEAARVELQRATGKPSGRLLLQEQDCVAAALGFPGADQLMAAIACAARAVAWASDDAWRRIESWLAGPRGRGGGGDRLLEPGLVLRDGEVALSRDASPAADPSLALRAAAASAELGRPLSRPTMDRLRLEAAVPPEVWPPEVSRALLRLLGSGPGAVGAVETLDQLGIWLRLLPEWAPVRNLPQRNAYHRFTVDRHLVETAAAAGPLLRRVARPDLLLLGALFHDIGKGQAGDHSRAGAEIVRRLGARLGLPPHDLEVLERLVALHLLLPETATRRDLEDPATAARVAAAVGSKETLELLAALAEADGLATGPSAWGPWKAGLLSTLVERVEARLSGRPHVPAPPEPTPEQRRLMQAGGLEVLSETNRLTVVAPDRQGLLATVAGVLALCGLTIRSAQTRSDPSAGMALLAFEVAPAFDRAPDWSLVRQSLASALEGTLPLERRLADRERSYARRRHSSAARPEVAVQVDNEASDSATVVEVRAPDAGPVLYRVARALADEGLSISCALVSTLGAEVVDAFYVHTALGDKVTDPTAIASMEAAVLSALQGRPEGTRGG